MLRIKVFVHCFVHACRELLDALFEIVWPTRCAGCEKLGALLCDSCLQDLPRIDQELACPRCGAPFGRLVCTECTPVYEPVNMAFSLARCALGFDELSKRVIVNYKDKGEQRLALLLAHLLAQIIPLEWRLWADVITWVPADDEAVKRRGFDHMALITVSLAAQTGLTIAPLLIKRTRKDQRSLNRRQREENMETLFSVLKTENKDTKPVMERIILIDDVFTTGATLHAAANVLLRAGAKEIRVATICRVW